ncbi:hypothetical protein QFC19_008835 [Naganishia cerealis]|uniref:Uncharacterized protein n=1 Tax=Naganishia cerealis TaxID=610337 RepID=A0ACC2UZ83_9TREE|nr:hypothetical protein QFC19_008835 [Naganishia cerealis]
MLRNALSSSFRPLRTTPTVNALRSNSVWAKVPLGPRDAILGVTEAFKADKNPKKINLGVGAYRDDKGKPYVLPSVQKAEQQLAKAGHDKEYLPITGLPEFVNAAVKLAYGENSKPLQEGRIAATQTISGTGALRLGLAFLARFFPHKSIYLPDKTWANHAAIVKDCGLEVKHYKYYDPETVGVAFEGFKADVRAAPNGSAFLLHAAAFNPLGTDLTKEQWAELCEIFKEKQHFAFFDMAYQGFASGIFEDDAFPVRHFVEQGFPIALCQSFAKNMGLYGERVGAFSLVCADKDEKARVDSQLKILIRPMYSNPPVHGARLAAQILNSPELYKDWKVEVKGMADRIIAMREALYDLLQNKYKTPGDWSHVKKQIGMFSYTGLKPEQVDALATHASIYLTRDGRISMAGLNSSNIEYFAENVSKAVKGELGPGKPLTEPPQPSVGEGSGAM